MNDYSIKELQTLTSRAAKGAYMPWGLAEEAAAAVCWLEHNQIMAIQPFVDLLLANEGCEVTRLPAACPVMTGAYLSDLRGTNLSGDPLKIGSLGAPVLLVPFLVWVANDLQRPLRLGWGQVQMLIGSEGVEIVSGSEYLDTSTPQDVEIAFAPDPPQLSGIKVARITISDRNRLDLERLVRQTHLPESEQSQASGAGGGTVDDD